MKLNCFEQEIEVNKGQWKKSLENWIINKISCSLEEQLKKYEVNAIEFNEARRELDCAQELFHLFNTKSLISVSKEENNPICLNEPHLVFQSNIMSDINWINQLSSENNTNIMKCQQVPDREMNTCEYTDNC